MDLQAGKRYEVSGINAVNSEGVSINLVVLALVIVAGTAVTIEPDETPSDNKQILVASTEVGNSAVLGGTAQGEDGSKWVARETTLTIVEENEPPPAGNFDLQFVQVE